MKLSYNQIESYAKNFDPALRGALIYGPDHGLIQERAAEILARILPNPDDPFAITDLTGDQVADDPALLFDEIASMNFFGGRKVVRIREHAEKAAKTIAELFKNPPVGAPKELGFLIVTAEELTPKSALRILFEGSSDIVALPCYHDEGAGLSTIIRQELHQRDLIASPDIIAYLSDVLRGDRMLVRQEIEKLDLYAGVERALTFAMVTSCIGDLAESTLDEIADYVASGNIIDADKKLRKALSQGIVPIVLLRSLSRHFQRMAHVAVQIEKGTSREQAVQQMRPPLFFKQQPIFKKQLGLWARTDKIRRALNLLYQAELRIKKGGLSPELITERALSSICKQAAQR